MKNVDQLIVWGLGEDFLQISRVLENNESFDVVAYVDNGKNEYQGKRVIIPSQLARHQYDYIVICTSKYFNDIENILLGMGVSQEKIIHGFVFLEKGFDYRTYKQHGWLNGRVINNSFSCVSYTDSLRVFKGKNYSIKLGRKSYVTKMLLEDGGMNACFDLSIGNYTSISSGVKIQIGMNLDHDYNRVFNYGLSHIKGYGNCLNSIQNKEHELTIESDVWIGQDCIVKSGINIGVGAVIASNSYVVSDVLPYSIVGGNPAKEIKKRFDDELIEALLRTKWWEMGEEELLEYSDFFDDPWLFVEMFNKRNEKHK